MAEKMIKFEIRRFIDKIITLLENFDLKVDYED